MIAADLTLTKDRSQVLDFSLPFMSFPVTVLTKSVSIIWNISSISIVYIDCDTKSGSIIWNINSMRINQLSLQFQGATNIERGSFGGIPSAFDQNTWLLLIVIFFVTSFFFWLVCRISPYEHLDSHQVLNFAFTIWDKFLFDGLHCVHDKMVFWYVYNFTFKLEHVTSTNSSRNFWEKNTIRKHI